MLYNNVHCIFPHFCDSSFLLRTGSVSIGVASVGHIHAGRRTTSGCHELQPHQDAPPLVCFITHVADCSVC